MRAAFLLGVVVALAACGDDGGPPTGCDPDVCAAAGQLCEGDVCVDPWRYGSPVWSTCPGEPRATAESLAAKAAGYDARLLGLHVHPEMPWVLDVTVDAGVSPESATVDDVIVWRSGENDGLWTGLALAAEAYRYAVTRDGAALTAVRRLLDGERTRMAITGVPGLFTRQLIPPGIAGIECPTDPAMYVPDPEKRANRWVRIASDGCVQVADAGTLQFASTTHCGLDEFAGWCFLDNISQDEYVGHMFGLAAVARLVDDPPAQAAANDMLGQIGRHLVEHDMEFTDWDGRATRWGKIHPGADGDSDGYLAVMAMSFLAVAARASGDPAVVAAEADKAVAYAAYLGAIDEWFGVEGCLSNWNDLSMLSANFHHLLWHVTDPPRRGVLADRFDTALMRAPVARAGLAQKNAWFDVMWAAQKRLGPDSDGPAYAAVEDAVCQLRQFPASNHVAAQDTTTLAPHACDGRSGESLAAIPFDVADRCAATFVWWGNPYTRRTCADEPFHIQQPAGYLLPYWMARYYGFVAADL